MNDANRFKTFSVIDNDLMRKNQFENPLPRVSQRVNMSALKPLRLSLK